MRHRTRKPVAPKGWAAAGYGQHNALYVTPIRAGVKRRLGGMRSMAGTIRRDLEVRLETKGLPLFGCKDPSSRTP
jgi:hypothetical protein